MKRPDRFSQSFVGFTSLSTHGLRWIRATMKPVRSGVVESLRGRMSEGERQVEGLFESLLSKSFGG